MNVNDFLKQDIGKSSLDENAMGIIVNSQLFFKPLMAEHSSI